MRLGPPREVCQEAGSHFSGLRTPLGDAPNNGLRAEELNPDPDVQRIGSKSKERVMAGSKALNGSKALKALVAAIQPGASAQKVKKIAEAAGAKDPAGAMKIALADMINVSPNDIDEEDAKTVLQITKASIPSGGVVPLY